MKKLFNISWYLSIASILILGCVSSTEVKDRETQKEYFKNRFGIELTEDIKEVKIKDHFIRDSWILFMKFSYNGEVFSRILESNFSEPIESLPYEVIEDAEKDAYKTFASKPEWFAIPDKDTELFYGRGKGLEPGNWKLTSEVIWSDSQNGFIYYICSAADD